MFGKQYRNESVAQFTKLSSLIDIPKCIDEINTHRLADQEYEERLKICRTSENIYFNNYGFKINNTPISIRNLRYSSFDYLRVDNDSNLSKVEKPNPFTKHKDDL